MVDVNALTSADRPQSIFPEEVRSVKAIAADAQAAAAEARAQGQELAQALADTAQQQLSNNQQTADALAALGGIPAQLSGLRVTATEDGYLFETDAATTTPATVQAAPLGGLLYEVNL